MTSTHLAICIRKFLVHFEPKVRINVVGRAKPLQKWLKIGQLMAIFSHKWLMLWPKNHIFINISWHGSCGPLLSSFEVLEVPKTDKSSIVWRHHSKSPVPICHYRLASGGARISTGSISLTLPFLQLQCIYLHFPGLHLVPVPLPSYGFSWGR